MATIKGTSNALGNLINKINAGSGTSVPVSSGFGESSIDIDDSIPTNMLNPEPVFKINYKSTEKQCVKKAKEQLMKIVKEVVPTILQNSTMILDKVEQDAEQLGHMYYESIRTVSNGRFSYAKFIKLKELARNSIGYHDSNSDLLISTYVSIYKDLTSKIDPLDKQISTIIKELNPRMLTIPGIGEISAASILSEFGDINNFSSPNKMLAFAGLEPSIIESGTLQSNGKMVKHGSSHLRYNLMNTATIILKFSPTFYDYYLKKRSEGKCHRVALSHVCKKLIRVIYILEKNNINFDPSLLK